MSTPRFNSEEERRQYFQDLVKKAGNLITNDEYNSVLDESKDRLRVFGLSSLAPSVVRAASITPLLGKIQLSQYSPDLSMFNQKHLERVYSVLDGMTAGGKSLRKYLIDRGIRLDAQPVLPFEPGPHFSHKNNTVHVTFKPTASDDIIRGVTAHGVGHAIRHNTGKLSTKIYGGSRSATSLLSLIGTLVNAQRDTSDRTSAIMTGATALASLPMLNEELQASRVGSKLVGLKGLKRLKAFAGNPSYLAAAAAPGIAFGAKKILTRKKDKKK